MKKALKGVGITLAAVALVLVGVLAYARSKALAAYEQSWDIEDHAIPIPFPLSDYELAELRAERAATAANPAPPPSPDAASDAASNAAEDPPPADPLAGLDLDALALERAVERGRRLVTTRLGCTDCHGQDFGGQVVMDVPPVGALIAPNITEGQGSVTIGYQPADWVRILRHGVGRDRQTSVMPAIDYAYLSDQEISDVAAYVRTFPPVDREMEPSRMGPVLWMQVGLGQAPPAAFLIDHDAPRLVQPPAAEPTAEYGSHLVQVCTGCHGTNFSGGPVAGGDPNWPAAANLTPHESGLAGWTYEDFERVFTEGVRKDGSTVRMPMPWQAMNAMTDVEKRAMFEYLRTLPPTPTGVR